MPIPPQTSLSNVNTYTTWPGGIDPTVSVYKLPAVGGKSRKAHRKAHRKATRKAHRKATRKVHRKATRKAHRKAHRKVYRH